MDQDLLALYYKRLFPFNLFYRWMNYAGSKKGYFENREFSFTLADDVYIRYLSFADQQDLEKEIKRKCPNKIDIGAVFTYKPKDHRTITASAFQPLEKELVFDIDMTDYDDVRKCCSGADICVKCWPLMRFAVKIIDRALREDFGFSHILWVYSGRRGIHCWVCDEVARKLTSVGRVAISEYLTIVKGGEQQNKKVTLSGQKLHPSIRQALSIISDNFENYAINNQDFLSTQEGVDKFLTLLPDDLREKIEQFWSTQNENNLNSHNRWQTIVKLADMRAKTYLTNSKKVDFKELHKYAHIVEEIKLQYCYPRLDVNVTKGVNHLLKSPFCVHPKTGRVCVPFDANDIDNFDPFSVPTLRDLCSELDDNQEDNKKRHQDGRSTTLKPALDVFTNFLKNLEKSLIEKVHDENDKSLNF